MLNKYVFNFIRAFVCVCFIFSLKKKKDSSSTRPMCVLPAHQTAPCNFFRLLICDVRNAPLYTIRRVSHSERSEVTTAILLVGAKPANVPRVKPEIKGTWRKPRRIPQTRTRRETTKFTLMKVHFSIKSLPAGISRGCIRVSLSRTIIFARSEFPVLYFVRARPCLYSLCTYMK